MKFLPFRPLLPVLLVLSASAVSADTLDWNTVTTWTAGVLTQSVTVGNTKVNFVITDPNAQLKTGGGGQTPEVNSQLVGGVSTTEKSLQLAQTATASTNVVTVTVSFTNLAGTQLTTVSGLNFRLFDIDNSPTGSTTQNYVDQIGAISARLNAGNPFSPIGITTSSGNSATTNTIIGVANVPNTPTGGSTLAQTAAGDATVNFGSQQLTSFTFNYANVTASTNPARSIQYVALSTINFTPVPEPATATALALGTVGLIGWTVRRRKQAARSR